MSESKKNNPLFGRRDHRTKLHAIEIWCRANAMNTRGGGATRLKTNMLKSVFMCTSWFVLFAFGKRFHKPGMALASPALGCMYRTVLFFVKTTKEWPPSIPYS
jgi:hypothetical protein